MSGIPAVFESRWNDVRGSTHAPLLKLAILRDLSRYLHKEKSHQMATSPDLLSPSVSETSLSFFLESDLQCETLPSFIKSIAGRTRRSALPALPERLTQVIPADKLLRYDRYWELHLAVHAIQASWSFWQVDLEIPIESIERAQGEMMDALWPVGLVLYAEEGFLNLPHDPSKHWIGRWILTLESKIDPRTYLKLPVQSMCKLLLP